MCLDVRCVLSVCCVYCRCLTSLWEFFNCEMQSCFSQIDFIIELNWRKIAQRDNNKSISIMSKNWLDRLKPKSSANWSEMPLFLLQPIYHISHISLPQSFFFVFPFSLFFPIFFTSWKFFEIYDSSDKLKLKIKTKTRKKSEMCRSKTLTRTRRAHMKKKYRTIQKKNDREKKGVCVCVRVNNWLSDFRVMRFVYAVWRDVNIEKKQFFFLIIPARPYDDLNCTGSTRVTINAPWIWIIKPFA